MINQTIENGGPAVSIEWVYASFSSDDASATVQSVEAAFRLLLGRHGAEC